MTPVKTLLLDLLWTMANTAPGQKGEMWYILKDGVLQSSLGICHSVIFICNTQIDVHPQAIVVPGLHWCPLNYLAHLQRMASYSPGW